MKAPKNSVELWLVEYNELRKVTNRTSQQTERLRDLSKIINNLKQR